MERNGVILNVSYKINYLSIYLLMKSQYTFIDLFSGCGGFSEGFYKQDFKAITHVEIDHYACETLKTRMRYYGYHDEDLSVLRRTLLLKTLLD